MPKEITKTSPLCMVEGSASVWHYHLKLEDEENTLCGTRFILNKPLPIDLWGFKSEHLSESYCTSCEKIARIRHIQIVSKYESPLKEDHL